MSKNFKPIFDEQSKEETPEIQLIHKIEENRATAAVTSYPKNIDPMQEELTEKLKSNVDLKSTDTTSNKAIHQAGVGKGRLIAQRFLDDGYHPVFFVGSSKTGKTAVLSSLIALMKNTPGVGIALGQALIDTNDAYGNEVYRNAKLFYNSGVQKVLGGEALPPTDTRLPFFVPIEITPKHQPNKVSRFAFLELNGEWFTPEEDSVDFYPEFREEMEAVLRHYGQPITMLYFAPLSQQVIRGHVAPMHQENDAQMRIANLAIVGGIERYNQVRTIKSEDQHIFILSKWDALHVHKAKFPDLIPDDPLQIIQWRDDQAFAVADAIAKNIYQQSYANFRTLPIPKERLTLMPYSSGLISGTEIVNVAEAQPYLDEHRRTLWNLIYAVSQPANSPPLYPKPAKPKQSLLSWLRGMLEKIF